MEGGKEGRRQAKKSHFYLPSLSNPSLDTFVGSPASCWKYLRVGSRLQWENQTSVLPENSIREILGLWLRLKEERQQPTRKPPVSSESSEKQLGPVSQALTTLPTPSAHRNILEKDISTLAAPPLLPCPTSHRQDPATCTCQRSWWAKNVPGTERDQRCCRNPALKDNPVAL